MASKGDYIPPSRISITDFTGAGHPRPQPRRAATRKPNTSQAISNTFKFRLNDVDSLSTFVSHLCCFPDNCFSNEYGAEWDTFRFVLGGTQSSFVGDGASFSVNVTTHRQFDAWLTSKVPETLLKKHMVIATKVPKIEHPPNGTKQSLTGVKEDSLKAVAWESHCLFHPRIRKSENIVELLGLCWETVEVRTTSGGASTHVPALIMEYADEGTLDDLLQSGECIDFALKMKLGLDVAVGLKTLHECGLVHCDLKANNVLLFRSSTHLLIAKVSDFGCATHSFGPDDTCLLPPYWPRWDAPEVRPKRSPVDMQDLPMVDVYSFGLLVWQIAFDGRTPFDRKRELSPLFTRVPQFAQIIAADASSFKEKELAIGTLKDLDNDEMLHAVQASIELLGLQNSQLDEVISHTLRRDPRQRQSMSKVVGLFKESGPNTSATNLQGQTTQLETSAAAVSLGDSKLPSIATSFEIESPAPIHYEDWASRYSEDDISRVNYGIYYPLATGAHILDLASATSLPNAVKRTIYQEYLDIALGEVTIGESRAMQITEDRKIFSTLQYGLCHLLGFGCVENDIEGMAWIERAANLGSGQARALVYRLQSACEEALPEPSALIKGWLESATVQGSLIAYEDLATIDPARARTCRKSYLDTNFGGCGQLIAIAKDYILRSYPMQDADAFRATILSSSIDEDGQSRTCPRVDEDVDGTGHSLLHYACALGHQDAVATLLQNSANINKQPLMGETALGYACRCGHHDIAYTLLEHGANAGLRNSCGATALHYLVYLETADLEKYAEKMIDNKANLNAMSMQYTTKLNFVEEAREISGTPLHWAVQHNRLDVVRVLLRLGADALRNEPRSIFELPGQITEAALSSDEEGTSPLRLAASLHRADILQAMIEHIGPSCTEQQISWLYAATSTSRAAMMIHNGAAYGERFRQIMGLARPALLRPATMTNALAFGNTMLVAHLLSSGYDANTVTGVGFTILYHALRHGAGIGAIKLLEHGADPTCSSPARQAGPLTIISFAPEGTHTDEVVRRLIDGGNTYDKEKESFIQLYHRAVIEGWDSTADLLIQNGLPREPSDRQLLKILLGQNSGRPLRGIKYLIKHASAKLVKDSRVDQETGDNVFHRLFGIQETIRNDELNFAILQLLLEVFGDPIMLNAPNKRGYSPATKAAHEGNFRAIEALGRHGVDISIGRPSPSPVQVVAGRIICPDKFDGDISTASSRGRKKRRYAENTTGLLRFLLGHFHPLGHSQDENEAIVRRRITLWQSSRFLEEAVRSGVDATSKESTIQVELDPDPASQTGFMVLETETGIRRSGNWKEMVMVTQNIWNAIVQDWNDTKTGNELGA